MFFGFSFSLTWKGSQDRFPLKKLAAAMASSVFLEGVCGLRVSSSAGRARQADRQRPWDRAQRYPVLGRPAQVGWSFMAGSSCAGSLGDVAPALIHWLPEPGGRHHA